MPSKIRQAQALPWQPSSTGHNATPVCCARSYLELLVLLWDVSESIAAIQASNIVLRSGWLGIVLLVVQTVTYKADRLARLQLSTLLRTSAEWTDHWPDAEAANEDRQIHAVWHVMPWIMVRNHAYTTRADSTCRGKQLLNLSIDTTLPPRIVDPDAVMRQV